MEPGPKSHRTKDRRGKWAASLCESMSALVFLLHARGRVSFIEWGFV